MLQKERARKWAVGTLEQKYALATTLMADGFPAMDCKPTRDTADYVWSKYGLFESRMCPVCKSEPLPPRDCDKTGYSPYSCSKCAKSDDIKSHTFWWPSGDRCDDRKWYVSPSTSEEAFMRYVGPLKYRQIKLEWVRGWLSQTIELNDKERAIDSMVKRYSAPPKPANAPKPKGKVDSAKSKLGIGNGKRRRSKPVIPPPLNAEEEEEEEKPKRGQKRVKVDKANEPVEATAASSATAAEDASSSDEDSKGSDSSESDDDEEEDDTKDSKASDTSVPEPVFKKNGPVSDKATGSPPATSIGVTPPPAASSSSAMSDK